MRFLIWQTAYLGDVVLATPLIETLKLNFPESEVAFVGRPFILELLKGSPVKLIPYDKSLRGSFKTLKEIKSYDVAVSPHVSSRTAIILALSGIRERIGFDRSELPFLYTRRVKHLWDVHEVERNLKLLEPLGIREKVRATKLYMSSEERNKHLRKFSLREKGYVVISPSSNFPLKAWYKEGWRELAESLSGDFTVVITGTKKDVNLAEFIRGKHTNAISLAGKTSLRELMAVVSGSRLVISNDSSPVHIANAFGVPAITIYTATSSLYGFYPLIGGFLESGLECSPCSPNPKSCKVGKPECLSSVRVNDVIDLAHKLLDV